MVRLRCICRSSMSLRNCIEGRDGLRTEAPVRDRRGFFFGCLGWPQRYGREINNADAVDLNPLWN